MVRALAHVTATAAFAMGAMQPLAAEIAQQPLTVTVDVPPNVIMAVDDSGSMDFEVLVTANDGSLWWNTDDESFIGRDFNDNWVGGVINFNNTGSASSTWKKYSYLFPNGSGVTEGRRGLTDGTHSHYAVPPTDEFAIARSPEFNAAYFVPGQEYEPWPDHPGQTFSDVPATAAPTDPVHGSETFNLTKNVNAGACADGEDHEQVYEGDNEISVMHPGMTIPKGACFRFIADIPGEGHAVGQHTDWQVAPEDTTITESDGRLQVAFQYFPATFYLADQSIVPDSFGYTATPVAAGTTPGGDTMYRYEIKPGNFSSSDTYDAAIQEFANWFTYYRKRAAAMRGGVGTAFRDFDTLRVGDFTINDRDNVTMRSLSEDAGRQAFYESIYSMAPGGGTPNRDAMNHLGLQFQRDDDSAPIDFACQANAGILFTDGFSNPDGPDVGNVDGDKGEPYADNVSDTIADISMKYYANHLRGDLEEGRVPTPLACSQADPDPSLNCNDNLHMQTYAVTLGTRGILYDPTNPIDPYENPPEWPTDFPLRHPSAVDDLWHATINGRGEMLNAGRGTEIGDKLRSALENFLGDIGSASSIATNSTRLDTETLIFQARFDSSDWSGEMLAFELDEADGTVSDTPKWRGEDDLDGFRNLVTFVPSGTLDEGIVTTDPSAGSTTAFAWSNLNDWQRGALNTNPEDGTTDSKGGQRLDWLSGDQSQEEQNGGEFRDRDRLLADIVNSNPLFVGAQDFGYWLLSDDDGDKWDQYRQFVNDLRDNEPGLLVGANDGKLHGFEAETGEEMFAYVPNMVYDHLSKLPSPEYQHRYLVDGSPRMNDVYMDGAWHRLTVGSLGAGGRGVFALDITGMGDGAGTYTPEVLWEITNEHDDFTNLGHVIGSATVALMPDENWYAIFGNGYESTTETASLYMVRVDDPTQVIELDTGETGGNGMSSPIPVDVDGDRITDAIYAGDLHGNLWKANVTDTNPGKWEFAHKGSPHFEAVARDGRTQPIMGRPEVGLHEDGGVMIYFGTGKYFEKGDGSVGADPVVQSFYAVRDEDPQSQLSGGSAPGPVERSELLQQEIIAETSEFGFDLRVTSENPPADNPDERRGWYLDLVYPTDDADGERSVSRPILRGSRVVFTTLIPSQDPCAGGGEGWLMEMNAMTGERLDSPPFDLNDDGEFTEEDNVEVVDEDDNTIRVPVSGKKSRVGIIQPPGIVSSGDKEYKYSAGSSGEIERTVETGDDSKGRRSWRERQ